MPKDELDNEADPLAEDDDVVDEVDEEEDEADDDEGDEFEDEDDEVDEDDEDVEEDTDVEARGSLTHEVGDEGGSPGEDMEISRRVSGKTRGSEGSETMPGGLRPRVAERRDDDDVLIKRPRSTGSGPLPSRGPVARSLQTAAWSLTRSEPHVPPIRKPIPLDRHHT